MHHLGKKLGRQTLLEHGGFKGGQIRRRVLAKPGLLAAGRLALLQRIAQAPPALEIRVTQLVLAAGLEARSGGREDANGAPDDRGRGRMHPPTGAALLVAGGAEQVLQVVVRPRKARNIVAVEQPWPVTGADLKEVRYRGR